MPSASERRALTLLTVVFGLGVAGRLAVRVRDLPIPSSADVAALDAQIARVESARVARAGKAGGRAGAGTRTGNVRRMPTSASRQPASTPRPSLRPESPVDLDTASEEDIEQLPWIGPALAQRIVASRDKCGPFGSATGLTRVYGIGEKLAARLAPHVTFSGASRPMGAAAAPGCAGAPPGSVPRRRSRS